MTKTYKIRKKIGSIRDHLPLCDQTLVMSVMIDLGGNQHVDTLLDAPLWMNGNTTRGGMFKYRRNRYDGTITPLRIELHPALFDEAHPERATERRETFLHEIAHYITAACLGGKGHGREWQRVMRMLRIPVSRCHDLDYVKSNRVQHVYECQTCPQEYSVGRKLKNDGKFHTCTPCKKYGRKGNLIRRGAPRVKTMADFFPAP